MEITIYLIIGGLIGLVGFILFIIGLIQLEALRMAAEGTPLNLISSMYGKGEVGVPSHTKAGRRKLRIDE